MDYHHIPSSNGWVSDQQPQVINDPSQLAVDGSSHTIQHSQAHPIVYGPSSHHQPISTYDNMTTSWAVPSGGSQTVMQTPQWSENMQPVGHTVTLDHPIQNPSTNICVHPTSQAAQQSHFNQYAAPNSYWTNSTIIEEHNHGMFPTTNMNVPPHTSLADHNPAVVGTTPYDIHHPNTSCAIQTTSHGVPIEPNPTSSQQPLPQYETHETTADIHGSSCQVTNKLQHSSHPEIQDSLEDALESISGQPGSFSGHQNSSCVSSDDEDDQPRSRKGNDRERERRQANNARER